MKKIFTKLYIILIFLCFYSNAKAQDYKNLATFRTGVYTGFMLKRLLPNESAFAAQVGFRDRGIVVSGYRMFHEPARPKKGDYKWFMYYGYGMHFRYYTRYTQYNPFKPWRPDNEYRGNYVAFGIDGILGFEYRFLKYPFVISGDISPNFEFGGANVFKVNMDMVSFGVGYTF